MVKVSKNSTQWIWRVQSLCRNWTNIGTETLIFSDSCWSFHVANPVCRVKYKDEDRSVAERGHTNCHLRSQQDFNCERFSHAFFNCILFTLWKTKKTYFQLTFMYSFIVSCAHDSTYNIDFVTYSKRFLQMLFTVVFLINMLHAYLLLRKRSMNSRFY